MQGRWLAFSRERGCRCEILCPGFIPALSGKCREKPALCPAWAMGWQLRLGLHRETTGVWWKGITPADRQKLEASELEHKLLYFLPFCVSTSEVINYKYWQRKRMMHCIGWCPIVLLAPCSQCGCSREECDGQARPDDLTVSSSLKVHESYHDVLLLVVFLASEGHFHMWSPKRLWFPLERLCNVLLIARVSKVTLSMVSAVQPYGMSPRKQAASLRGCKSVKGWLPRRPQQ